MPTECTERRQRDKSYDRKVPRVAPKSQEKVIEVCFFWTVCAEIGVFVFVAGLRDRNIDTTGYTTLQNFRKVVSWPSQPKVMNCERPSCS